MKSSFYIFIDWQFLRLTEIIAKYIYRLIGLNNFRLANILYVIGWSCEMASWALLFQTNSLVKNILAIIFFTIARLFTWFIFIFMPSKIYKVGFMNKTRESFLFIINRMFFLQVVVIMFLFLDPREPTQPFILANHFDNFGSLFIAIAYYFASIEPENPTDSWIKKKWNSFKRLFEWSPVAQPA